MMNTCSRCNGSGIEPKELSQEMEAYVIRLYHSGDEKKREEAIRVYCEAIENLLASAINAVGVGGTYLEFRDFLSEAYIVALDVLDKYIPDRESRLSTYLWKAVKNSTEKVKAKALGITPHYAKAAKTIYCVVTKICNEKQIEPQSLSDLDISEVTGISLATVKKARGWAFTINLSEPDDTLYDVHGPKEWEPEHWSEEQEKRKKLKEATKCLNDAEAFVVNEILQDRHYNSRKVLKKMRDKGFSIYSAAQVDELLERATSKMSRFIADQ